MQPQKTCAINFPTYTLPLMEKKVHPVSMRLTENQYAQIQEICAKIRLPITNVISLAIDGLLDYYKAHDGRITLPLDFTQFFTEARELLNIIEHRDSARDDYIEALRAIILQAGLPLPALAPDPTASLPRAAEEPPLYRHRDTPPEAP